MSRCRRAQSRDQKVEPLADQEHPDGVTLQLDRDTADLEVALAVSQNAEPGIRSERVGFEDAANHRHSREIFEAGRSAIATGSREYVTALVGDDKKVAVELLENPRYLATDRLHEIVAPRQAAVGLDPQCLHCRPQGGTRGDELRRLEQELEVLVLELAEPALAR